MKTKNFSKADIENLKYLRDGLKEVCDKNIIDCTKCSFFGNKLCSAHYSPHNLVEEFAEGAI